MVGTPAVMVTSSFARFSSMLSGSMCAPGMTCFAPTSVEVNGSPQALTWNIGTTGMTTSRSRMFRVSAIAEAMECRQIARCEYSAPFGRPVVPEV